MLKSEPRLASRHPHPHVTLKEKACIERLPRIGGVHDRELEIPEELDEILDGGLRLFAEVAVAYLDKNLVQLHTGNVLAQALIFTIAKNQFEV